MSPTTWRSPKKAAGRGQAGLRGKGRETAYICIFICLLFVHLFLHVYTYIYIYIYDF